VLLLLVEKGLSRKEAYKLVQQTSHGLHPGEQLQSALLKNDKVKKLIKPVELAKVFSGEQHQKTIGEIIERVL
jgi:adenylosuccinate lyase